MAAPPEYRLAVLRCGEHGHHSADLFRCQRPRWIRFEYRGFGPWM